MLLFTDQTGNTIQLSKPPQRIISLVPSQTELLYHLGLDEEVIGITKFCVHPYRWFQKKTRVGGTKNIHQDIIKKLNPDLVIANKEENVKKQIEEIQKYFPVWVSDVATIGDAFEMIKQLGLITEKSPQATTLINQINKEFARLNTLHTEKIKCAYLIWKNPYITVGGDTFINAMLLQSGFQNVFANKTRYPQVTTNELIEAQPQVLLLSSEPYPFAQKHIPELQQALPHSKIILADGELFSWYGSRMQYAPAYFLKLQQSLHL